MTIGNAEMAHLQIKAHKAMLAATNAKKPRRTAVERAAESLEKAKAKARARLLKLAIVKLDEAGDMIAASGDALVNIADGDDGVGVMWLLAKLATSLREELGE